MRSAMDIHAAGHRSTVGAEASSILGPILFLLALLLVCIGTSPFQDLSDPTRIQAWAEGNRLNQVLYCGLGLAAILTALSIDRRITEVFRRPIYILCLAWFALTVLISSELGIGVRRFGFTVLIVALAGVMLILPRNERQFTALLSAVGWLVLSLCYLGVMFAPELAVHQATDTFMRSDADAVLVSNLTGEWRGLFTHKNAAAPIMAILVFVGLFVAQTRSALEGWAMVLAASVFLFFTGGKTATLFLPAILVMSLILVRLRTLRARAVLVIGGLLFISIVTLGSAYFESVRNVTGTFLSDVTFTDRSEIWRLAIDYIRQKPIFGYGFGNFWGSDALVYGETSLLEGAWAPNAHNAYLDLVLAAGVPGLVLGGIWVLITPLVDFQRVAAPNANMPLSVLFLRIWLFGIYLACFESILFARDDAVWFLMLISMFGLYLMTKCRIATR